MSRKLFNTTIILLVIISSPQGIGKIQAQTTGNPITIDPAPNYQFSGYVQSFLTWEEDQTYLVKLNLSLVTVPDNGSRIQIVAFTFDTVASIGGVDGIIDQVPLVVDDMFLSPIVNSIEVNRTLSPPDEADRFYINIGIFARTIGNISQVENLLYTIRFPDEGTIIVSRDALAPLVNLYGSPPGSFFQKWFPVYGFFIALMLIPAFTMGINYFRFSRKNENANQILEQTNEDKSEEVVHNE